MVMKHSWINFIRIAVLSIVLGGAAGIITTALTTNYLADYALELSELTEPLRIAEQRPVAFPASLEEAIEQFRNEGLISVAQLVSSSEETIVARSDELPPAIVLTSDGWMLAYGQDVPERALTSSGVCDIDTSAQDPRTLFQFLKCETQSLSVAGFGSGLAVQPGDQVFVATSEDSFSVAHVSAIRWSEDIPHTLDLPARRLVLDVQALEGAPVFDLSGKLIALIDEQQSGRAFALPIDSLLPKFNRILEGESLNQDMLGLQGIDLAHVLTSEQDARGYKVGVLVTGAARTDVGSLFPIQTVEVDDIILSVNGEFISATRSIDEILLAYKTGDSVTLSIDRDGEVIELDVTLGAL